MLSDRTNRMKPESDKKFSKNDIFFHMSPVASNKENPLHSSNKLEKCSEFPSKKSENIPSQKKLIAEDDLLKPSNSNKETLAEGACQKTLRNLKKELEIKIDEYLRNKSTKDVPIPRGNSAYCKAKRAEYLERDLEKAVKYYKIAIKNNERVDSAIKDLATVLHQQGKTQEACEFLEASRSNYKGEPDKYENLLNNLRKQITPSGNCLNRTFVLPNVPLYYDEAKIKNLFSNNSRIIDVSFCESWTEKEVLALPTLKSGTKLGLISFMSYSAARKTYETLKDQKVWTPYWMNVHGEILGLVSEEPVPMPPPVRSTLSNSKKSESDEKTDKTDKTEAVSKTIEPINQSNQVESYSTPSSRISVVLKDEFSSTQGMQKSEIKEEEESLFFDQISVSKKLEFTDERINNTPSQKLNDQSSEDIEPPRTKRTKEELIQKQNVAWEWKLFPVPTFSAAEEEDFDLEKEDLLYSIIEKIFTDADDNPLIPASTKIKTEPQQGKTDREHEFNDSADLCTLFRIQNDSSNLPEQPATLRKPPGIFPTANQTISTSSTAQQRAPHYYYNQVSYYWPQIYPSKHYLAYSNENVKSNHYRNGQFNHTPTYPNKQSSQNSMTYYNCFLSMGHNLRK